MALAQLGAAVADLRGSIGGATFSRCAGGNYIRSRIKPVNPRSAKQVSRRSVLGQLSAYWSSTLEEQERLDWNDYAANTGWTNRLGQSIQVTGLAAFVRLNALLIIAGEAIREAAPLQYGHAGTPTFTILAGPTAGEISFTEPSAPFDADADDSMMLWFEHLPAPAGRLAIPKASEYLGMVEGDSTTPPTFPDVHTAIHTMTAGQRITCRGTFIDPSFRVGGDHYAQVIAVDP